MKRDRSNFHYGTHLIAFFLVLLLAGTGVSGDLEEIKAKGVLLHLGVPYANFVTGSGDGLDVEMVQLFANHLGVKYQYVQTSWADVIADLSGKKVKPEGDNVEVLGSVPVKGDLAANGLTILPWREKVVDFVPTFPNQVWLIARADVPIKPIEPSGDTAKDIAAVKAQLKGHKLLGMPETCLDPRLYELDKAGAEIHDFPGTLNEIVPAIINGEAEAAIQDVPDALIAVEKWPGKIKIVGPVSSMQYMGYAFAESSPHLRDAFIEFFEKSKNDGTYSRIVMKYYPAIFKYYPQFFVQK